MCTNHKTFFLCLLSLMFCNCKETEISNPNVVLGYYFLPSYFENPKKFYTSFHNDNLNVVAQTRALYQEDSRSPINYYIDTIRNRKNDFLDYDYGNLCRKINEILNNCIDQNWCEFYIEQEISHFVKNIIPEDLDIFFNDFIFKGALNRCKENYTSLDLFYYLATSISDFVFVTDKAIEQLASLKQKCHFHKLIHQQVIYGVDRYITDLIQQCYEAQNKIFDLYRTKIDDFIYQMTGIPINLEYILMATDDYSVKIYLSNRKRIFFPIEDLNRVLTRCLLDCKCWGDRNKLLPIGYIFECKDVASVFKNHPDVGFNRLKEYISSAILTVWEKSDDIFKKKYKYDYERFFKEYIKNNTIKDLCDDLIKVGCVDITKFPSSPEEALKGDKFSLTLKEVKDVRECISKTASVL